LLTFISVALLVSVFATWVVNTNAVKNVDVYTGAADNWLTRSFLGPVVSALAKHNRNERYKLYVKALDKKLLYAGRPGGALTAHEFMAGIELLSFSVYLLFLVLGFFSGNFLAMAFLLGPIAALLAFWLAGEYLQNLVTDRVKSISRQYPSFLDLGVMATRSGASFLETLEIYVGSNRDMPLGVEFGMALQDIRMGATIEEALRDCIVRVPDEPVRSSLDAIIQGQNIGTPVADLLEDQAEGIRFHRSQAAERSSEELKVKIMGPIVLMMRAVFLLILGPAVLEVMQSGIV
jgi:tight adherence protein C